MSDQYEIVTALTRVDQDNAINCTGPGEVGCKGREGWHTWSEHRVHVAEAQVDRLREMGAI